MLFGDIWLHIVLTEPSTNCPILQFVFACKLANLGVFIIGCFTLDPSSPQRLNLINRTAVNCAPGFLKCNFFL